MSGIRRARDYSRRRRSFTAAAVALAAIVVLLLAAAGAFADAGNPILGTIKATAVDNGNGTVTVFVRGQWNWYSHGSDCNANRAGAGVGIIWDDLNGPGTSRGADEVQKIALSGTTAGAHFTLTFKNPAGTQSTSAAINSTDTAAQLQAKLEAMASIGSGNVSVTGGPGTTTPWNVEFTGALGNANVNGFTAGGKTGGLNVTITTTTAGSTPVYNGYLVANGGISAYVGTSSAEKNGNTVINPVDEMVHPDDRGNQVQGYNVAGTDYPAGQQFTDPSPANPNSYTSWKGGCGRQPISSVGPNGSGTSVVPSEESTQTCADGTTQCNGEPWGSWGYEKQTVIGGTTYYGYSHTYLKKLPDGSSGLPDKVCVNFYDVHGGGTPGTSSFQVVNGAKEITVDQNGDNSIDTNAFNVFDTSQGGNCIAVSQAAITTSASSETIGDAGGIGDDANLTGVPAGAGGTITFNAYGPSATANCTTNPVYTSTISVNGPGHYLSKNGDGGEFDPTSAGNYFWTASYSGDQAHLILSASTGCGDSGETSNVGKKQPAVTTDAGPDITLGVNGSDLTDMATISNAFAPFSGALTFTLYADNGTGGCGTQIGQVTTTLTNASNGTFTSSSVHVSSAGTYHWIANYGGDGNNFSTSNVCNNPDGHTAAHDENVVVGKRPTSITTDAGGPFTFDPVNGNNLADKATLSGGTAAAVGHLTFTLYSDSGCNNAVNATPVTATEDPLAHGANGFQYISNTVHVTAAGTYHWIATYSGDANNSPSSTMCLDSGENPQVLNPSIAIDKSPNNQTIETGTQATFSITVSNNGQVGLSAVSVSDPNSTDCNRSTSQIEALIQTKYSHGFPLGVGESVSYNCQSPTQGANTTLHNVATDQGTSQGVTVTANDSADVKIIHPQIDVQKDPKQQSVPSGGTANFTITVTNTGDSPLTGIVVTDAMAQGCAETASQTAAQVNTKYGRNDLRPGESFSYTCSQGSVTVSFLNIVQACGNDELSTNVCDNDTDNGGPPGCPEAARCAQVSVSGVSTLQDFLPRDAATITGLVGSPGGSLTFSLYRGPGCDPTNQLDLNGPNTSGQSITVNVTANGSYSAVSASLLSAMLGSTNTAGTYNWLVSYSGDNQGNAAIPGTCGTENFTVNNG